MEFVKEEKKMFGSLVPCKWLARWEKEKINVCKSV